MTATVSAWAERLLFGDTLDDKLVRPGRASDAGRPAPLTRSVPFPGRPQALRPTRHTWRTPRFDTDAGRAAAVHAFANHELLAIELFALALLRFPEAPPAFRTDLVRTIAEEQRHLRAYLTRLHALDVPFGSLPVNGWFWQCLSGVQAPVELVAGLSLTFEAANLDHATWYRDRFTEAGDGATAAVLDTVLRDEIGHVATGARWLAHWTPPGVSRVDAWHAARPAGLAAARARGPIFCRAAREAAGLDADLIDAVRAAPWSRGRPVTAWTVNLDAEATLAARTLPAAVRRRLADLAPSVAFLAEEGDVVVVPRPDSGDLRRRWLAAGVRLPTACAAHPVADPEDPLAPTQADAWARTPAWHAGHPSLTRPAPQAAQWFSKAHAPALCAAMRADLPDLAPALSPVWADPVTVASTAELEAVRASARAHGVAELVLKMPWSAAGGGLRRLSCAPGAGDAMPAWVGRGFAAHGVWVAEPWWPRRVVDLSLLLDLDTGLSAVRRAVVGPTGHYEGHLLGDPWRGLAAPIRAAVFRRPSGPSLRDAAASVLAWLQDALRARGLTGRVGVDAFLAATDLEGSLALRPIVELNPRCTMGHVALALERHVHPGAAATWRHLSLRSRSAGEVCAALEAALPQERDPRSGRVRQGALPTADPASCTEVLPMLLVAATPDALHQALTRAVHPTDG